MIRSRIPARTILAIGLAIVGIGLAWRALHYSLGSKQRSSRLVSEANAGGKPSEVDLCLAKIVFDSHPTADTLTDLAETAKQRVCALCSETSSIAPQRVVDLGTAFAERLLATLGGDFDGNVRALHDRGDALTADEAESLRGMWERQAAESRLAPFSMSQIEIHVISERGHLVDAGMPFFGALSWEPTSKRFALQSAPGHAEVDVVEIRVPMEKKTAIGRELRPVFVGYRFAWSEARSQWIPWRIYVYHRPGEAHAAIMF